MEEYDERRTYRIGLEEVWEGGKHKKYWFVNTTGVIPSDQEPPPCQNNCLEDAAEAIVKHFRTSAGKRENFLGLLATTSETIYQICSNSCRLCRPPTNEEMKQLGEEVLKALKGE